MRRLLLLAAVLLPLATACGTSRSVVPAPKPRPQFVVYTKPGASRHAPRSLWRAHLDGSHAKRLGTGSSPAVSPDGRSVAFVHHGHVLVIRSAGSAAKRVYSLKGSAPSLSSLGWAPDSRHLAFLTNGKLVLLDTVSRRARTVHAKDYDTIDSFRFSPDSREILYSVVRQIYIYALSWNGWPGYNPFSTRAYVVATTGGKPHRIGGKTATIGMFSPDSSKIVYASGGNIYVVPVRGGEAVRLTHEHRDSNPVWGKPGIAFLRGGRRGKLGDIWISDGTRRRPRQLTHAGAGMTPVMFSAKGNELLASNGGLWSVGSHWGGCAFCPAVVPVHTLIAPQSFVIQERVWAVDARTGAARRIPPLGRGVRARGISADGHTVLASVDCSAPHGYVETVPLRRGKPHVIARGSCDSSWSAGPQLPR